MDKYKQEQYEIRYKIDGRMCHVCCNPATQIAHRMNNSKINRILYSNDIVNHNYNLVPVCGLSCNSKVNMENKLVKKMKLIELIRNADKEMTSTEIDEYLEIVR